MNKKKELIENLKVEIEGVANFLMGMSFDPSIPDHVKEALKSKYDDLDKIIGEWS